MFLPLGLFIVTAEAVMPCVPSPLVTIGETLALLTSPSTGPLRHARFLTVGIAGAESNVAIGFHRLGLPALWIGRVGEDEFGKKVVNTIRGEGVSVDAKIDSGAVTGIMIKEQRTADVMRVFYYRQGSAGSRLSVADIDEQALRQASVLHITGITPALSESARACVFSALEVARDVGVPISLDYNYRRQLWSPDEATPVLRDLTKWATLVFTGTDEGRLVAGNTDVEAFAVQLSSLGPQHVVVKRGAEGSIGISGGETIYQAPFPVNALDTVGAGDAFVAGYLSQFVRGRKPAECLRVGSMAGAFSASVVGDWEGLPEADELALLEYGAGEVIR